jgi:regulator of sigma E protease
MLFDFLLVALGFTLIIVLHELGHFVAARWAGVRVLAFAVGFGPALFSFRKGLGWRVGSSEKEYHKLAQEALGPAGESRERARDALSGKVSATEYRWNIVPFGGYVKMLGQDDSDPGARSDAPDSYNVAKPWKRMIIVSAGVVMNVILAAVLFVVVFMLGLRTEAPRIGTVAPTSPAAFAVASNAQSLGVTHRGLMPGDTILAIDGSRVRSFQDIQITSAMARKGRAINLDVQRPGVDGTLRFSIVPRVDPNSNMLALGIGPMATNQLLKARDAEGAKAINEQLRDAGFDALRSGMTMSSIEGVTGPADPIALDHALDRADGQSVQVTFKDAAGQSATVSVRGSMELARQPIGGELGERFGPLAHLAGLTPVMMVRETQSPTDPNVPSAKSGLKPGDIFARIGEGLEQIKLPGRTSIDLTVLRNENGAWIEKELKDVPVSDGKVGFLPALNITGPPIVAGWSSRLAPVNADGVPVPLPAGATLRLAPGSRIVAVAGAPTASLTEVRQQIRKVLTTGARTVELTVREPRLIDPRTTSVRMVLSEAEASEVLALGWDSPLDAGAFEREQVVLKASSPIEALSMGMNQTHNAMLQTYLTLARLFQGSVKVEHLKGPVGIAHVGTILTGRGYIWLLFFMAAISVNLAVINFLPLPIVDGGQFLFILYEQLVGRPVSVMFQNVATLAGLALIGSMFLIVTFNDLRNLFTP